MITSTETIEGQLLSCCYADGETIDMALAAGIGFKHFAGARHGAHWKFLCELRAAGKSTELDSVYVEAVKAGRLADLGGGVGLTDAAGASSLLHRKSYISGLLDGVAKREAYAVLALTAEGLMSGQITLEEARHASERAASICTGTVHTKRGMTDIADEALKDVNEQIGGQAPTRSLIYTGLPTFDRVATPMESHEYVVVGARTSHGKSSFLTQVAGHNLAHHKKVVIFTLETSDKAVLKQIVAQRSGVNVREIGRETAAKQQEYVSKLQFAKTTKNLVIYDRDLSLAAIEARCRLLAATFKPDLVIVDYLGIIGVPGTSQYERITSISKAMIPLRKALGCVLMVGCQLGRGSEKEEREPTRTDFRDSGSIEEDASRLIVLYRTPGQALDLTYFDTSIMQLKMRDGPLCRVDCRFHGPTTRFLETAAAA